MEEIEKFERYKLRKAAGMYWLLDVEQESDSYKAPVQINELGARIFELLSEGKKREEIVSLLAGQYEIESDEVAADVDEFLNQLQMKL